MKYCRECAGWRLALILRRTPLFAPQQHPTADPEDIGIVPVIVAELEFRHIERQILLADFMKCSDHSAFDKRPKALNRVCVNCADDILAFGMVNGAVAELSF